MKAGLELLGRYSWVDVGVKDVFLMLFVDEN